MAPVPRPSTLVKKLNQAEFGPRSKLAKVAHLEGLNEHRRAAIDPPVPLECIEEWLFEGKTDAAEVRWMLCFGVHADGPSELAFELLGKRDDFVERWNCILAIKRTGPRVEALAGAKGSNL